LPIAKNPVRSALVGQLSNEMVCINKIILLVFISTYETLLTIFHVGFLLNRIPSNIYSLFYFHRYSHLRFVRTKEVLCRDLPLLPTEIEEVIRSHCAEARSILQNKLVPSVVTVDSVS